MVSLIVCLNPIKNFTCLIEAIFVLLKHRMLIIEMAKRDLADQYVGQVFGKAWIFIHPLFLMGLYLFIFGWVFQSHIDENVEMPLNYTVYMLSGLIPWLSVLQFPGKSCAALLGYSNLVKQLVFPVEVLPIKVIYSSFITLLVGFAVLMLYVMTHYGLPHSTYFFLPVLIIFQAMMMIGLSFLCASLSVYFRDLKDVISIVLVVGIYLMPVVYLPQWVPNLFRPLLYLNFFSYMIWCYQDILYFGRFEHPCAWFIFCLGSVALFICGYRVFRFLKPHFGSVL